MKVMDHNCTVLSHPVLPMYDKVHEYVKVNLLVCFQGYYGIAVGKAQQTAKTEIEKLKVCIQQTRIEHTYCVRCLFQLFDMKLEDAVKEAAKMYVFELTDDDFY
jgi:hypothetical protein